MPPPTPEWLTERAAQLKCAKHDVPLVGKLIQVRTGLYSVLRAELTLGKCPIKDCCYTVEIGGPRDMMRVDV